MSRIRLDRSLLAVATVALLGDVGVRVPSSGHAASGASYRVQWLQAMPQQPRTVIIGGTIGAPACKGTNSGCGGWDR